MWETVPTCQVRQLCGEAGNLGVSLMRTFILQVSPSWHTAQAANPTLTLQPPTLIFFWLRPISDLNWIISLSSAGGNTLLTIQSTINLTGNPGWDSSQVLNSGDLQPRPHISKEQYRRSYFLLTIIIIIIGKMSWGPFYKTLKET